MKKSIFCLLLFFICLGLSAQTEEVQDPFTLAQVESLPMAPGCKKYFGKKADLEAQKECLQHYILSEVAHNYRYPEEARQLGVQARIFITFVIERNGQVKHTEIVKSAASQYKDADKEILKAAKSMDEEAIRVVKELEFERPAMQKEKAVRMSFTLPLNLHLG